MMEELLDKLLLLTVENEVVEFKEAKTQFDKDKLGQYFSALSNEANIKGLKQSWLIFGVKNDRSIVGTSISDKQLNEYKAEIGKQTSPRCSFIDVFRIEKNGKTVIMLEIPAAPQGYPVSWKGHRYGRDGESLVPLTDTEYDKIKSQITLPDWSKQIIEDATIDDLSKEAILFAKTQYKEKNPRLKDEIDHWSDEIFLNIAKITIQGKITNTAILLLGNSESEHFISPATAKITWILKDKDNIEKDYEHFCNPLIFAIKNVSSKIRNLKYRYIKSDTLFPDEVDQYDPYIIREALHNCIAHQDYTLGGKIIVVENEDGWLLFTNDGSFIPNSVEEVVLSESPESKYRNKFLADAMVNLNMIDTIGSGIKKMYKIQKEKFFPLPEYDLKENKVKVSFFGKVINIDYARKIAQIQDLSFEDIILMDKVAKQKPLSDEEAKILKSKHLIEGRKPNYYIGIKVAQTIGQKADYSKNKAFDKQYYIDLIKKAVSEHNSLGRSDIDILLWKKLSDSMSDKQKKIKINNLIAEMRETEIIKNIGTFHNPKWILVGKKIQK